MAKSNKPNNTAGIHLSKLETTVLCGICQGLSSNDLAKIIHKSPRTVDDYRKALCKKFGVQNKEQLIAKVVALEFVPHSKII
jgi:DNA-binding CsgD family transcriptional regulator